MWLVIEEFTDGEKRIFPYEKKEEVDEEVKACRYIREMEKKYIIHTAPNRTKVTIYEIKRVEEIIL